MLRGGPEVGSAPPVPETVGAAPTLRRDLFVVVAAAVVVQLVFPYRHDWSAHLVGGGGAMVGLAAVAPRAVRRVTAPAAFATVVALAWSTEVLLFPPFDLVDVAYTLSGAVLAHQAADRLARASGRPRLVALVWSAVLVLGALAYRFATSYGPM